MKLSLSWIKDYVKIPEDMDLKKLAYDLTMSTVEVEDVEYLAKRFEKMVVGVIEKVEPHPNADKLRVCTVDIGEDECKADRLRRHQPAGRHACSCILPRRDGALAWRGRAGGDQEFQAAGGGVLRDDLRVG